MTFGEKIQKLRKEKGLSQEELSCQLDVSRQAISKWENDNGYPETEKIVRMSKIFNVTLDYLLGEENDKNGGFENEKGIYVSREMTSGFLSYQKVRLKKIAMAIAIFISSLSLSYWVAEISMIVFMIAIIIGIALLISVKISDNPYRKIGKEPLLFDKDVRNELVSQYTDKKSKYHLFIIIGSVFIAVGFLLVPLIAPIENQQLNNLCFISGMIIAGIGSFLCIYFWGIIRAYRILITTINN